MKKENYNKELGNLTNISEFSYLLNVISKFYLTEFP
jgi:hypothetical protein